MAVFFRVTDCSRVVSFHVGSLSPSGVHPSCVPHSGSLRISWEGPVPADAWFQPHLPSPRSLFGRGEAFASVKNHFRLILIPLQVGEQQSQPEGTWRFGCGFSGTDGLSSERERVPLCAQQDAGGGVRALVRFESHVVAPAVPGGSPHVHIAPIST